MSMPREGGKARGSIRVAVLAHALRTAGGLTIGRNLIRALIDVAPDNEYCLIVPDGVGYEEDFSTTSSVQVHAIAPLGVIGRLKFDHFGVRRLVESFGPDVVLALDTSHSVRDSPWPQAVFVHAAHLMYTSRHYGPRTLNDRIRHAYLKRHFRRALGSTDLVFAQTKVIASRLRRKFDFSGPIAVCGTSISPSFLAREAAPLRLPDRMLTNSSGLRLFSPARYYPHKNIERIVELFHRYSDELTGVVVFLTIERDQHPNVDRILTNIQKWGLAEQIVNLGEIPHQEIGVYYRHCGALLMPTTLEAFSTAYVEAMASDLPILTSDLDFAHASCGDAALYFDPWDISDIKNAILRLKEDGELRDQLVVAGQSKTQLMPSWVEVARIVLDGLQDAVMESRTLKGR